MNRAEIEQDIQDKNLNAPRLTPDGIDAVIAAEDYHVFPGSQLTVCCLTLANGYTVTGESACVSPANFDAEIGRKVSREKAKEQIWALEGYRLKQEQFAGHGQDGSDAYQNGRREGVDFGIVLAQWVAADVMKRLEEEEDGTRYFIAEAIFDLIAHERICVRKRAQINQ